MVEKAVSAGIIAAQITLSNAGAWHRPAGKPRADPPDVLDADRSQRADCSKNRQITSFASSACDAAGLPRRTLSAPGQAWPPVSVTQSCTRAPPAQPSYVSQRAPGRSSVGWGGAAQRLRCTQRDTGRDPGWRWLTDQRRRDQADHDQPRQLVQNPSLPGNPNSFTGNQSGDPDRKRSHNEQTDNSPVRSAHRAAASILRFKEITTKPKNAPTMIP